MLRLILLAFLCAALLVSASPAQAQSVQATTPTNDDISGMYTFLQEGEFVQINLEDGNHVSGFISRYGDGESDHGAFLDHMFKEAELKGTRLHFVTKPVHGVWFEFRGTVERGDGKDVNSEGYRVLKGKLTEYSDDANRKQTAKSREVTFKSFPQDLGGTSTDK